MKSPEPQFQERLFLVSWWKGVMLVAWLMGANMVKEAVPVLSTHKCLKKLPALLDRMGQGSVAFTFWSTPHHTPVRMQSRCDVKHLFLVQTQPAACMIGKGLLPCHGHNHQVMDCC